MAEKESKEAIKVEAEEDSDSIDGFEENFDEMDENSGEIDDGEIEAREIDEADIKDNEQSKKKSSREKSDTKQPKQYECDVCHKIWLHKSYLNRHMRIHTGEKSIVCHICGKRFYQTHDFTKHVRTHTGKFRQCTRTVGISNLNRDIYTGIGLIFLGDV